MLLVSVILGSNHPLRLNRFASVIAAEARTSANLVKGEMTPSYPNQ